MSTKARAIKKRKPRPTADERFRQLIDDFAEVDIVFKRAQRERKVLAKRIINIVRQRGRGIHLGNRFAVNAFDNVREILDREKVSKLLTARQLASCFKKSRFIQLISGPLTAPPEKSADASEDE